MVLAIFVVVGYLAFVHLFSFFMRSSYNELKCEWSGGKKSIPQIIVISLVNYRVPCRVVHAIQSIVDDFSACIRSFNSKESEENFSPIK